MLFFSIELMIPSWSPGETFIETLQEKALDGAKYICPLCFREEGKTTGNKKSTLNVNEIQLNGNFSFSSSRLKELMNTKEKTILHPFRESPFDEEVLKEDIERLKQFYQSEGFYNVTITGYRVEKITDQSLRISINISEGSPTRVKSIMVAFKTDIDPRMEEAIKESLPLKEGAIFRTESYRDCEKTVLRYLAEEGYPKARVNTSARIFSEEQKAFVWIDVDIGPKCTFGSLKIDGIRYVDEKEILRLVSFKKGELFKASKIRESQKRLWDSQLFSFVDITVKGLDGEDTELPIVITVKEAKPYTIRAGAGYGTEDGLRGKLSFEARRFLGDARRLNLQAKASNLTQQLETRFLQPHFLTDEWWLELRGGVGRTNEASYEAEGFYVTAQLNFPLTSTMRGFIGPNVETNKITNLEIYPYNPNISDRQRDNYFISSIIVGLAEERIDDLIDPTKGFRFFATTEWASDIFGSEVGYIKSDLELRTYFPFRTGWILANRIHWGVISNPETGFNTPIFKRFFAGGSNSNRGYPYHKLGPVDDYGNPLGGKSIFESNTDMRFPLQFISKDLDGVLFLDIGQVFPNEQIMMDNLKYSIGVGLRYKTIVGPIRADLGYAINPPERNPSSAIQFFLSIGQAF